MIKQPTVPILWAIFTLELLALLLLQLPSSYNFSTFVFYDPGSIIRADWLLAEGLTPTIDFGFSYGMLSLLCGRLILAIGGRTPAAYLIGTLLLESLTMWGVARMAARMSTSWRWESIALLIVAMPHAILPVYLGFTHPLEAALLTNAIADLSLGRRSRALALATACVFVKPTMAYPLGLLLLLSIARFLWRSRDLKSWTSHLAPATLTAIGCAIVSTLCFGWEPLVNSMFPFDGKRSYDALDFGFFGNGKRFWLPELSRASDFVWYYLTTPAGFWIIASLLLCAWGFRALWRRAWTAEHEALIALAACHLFFIFLMYAWPGSWTYYSYLLVIGVCLGWNLFHQRALMLAPLLLLALSTHTELYRNTIDAWRLNERSPITAGLWADGQQREEWMRVLTLARRRPLLFLHNGCANLLFPDVQGPRSCFLSPAVQTPREIATLRRQIDQAAVIVTFNHAPILDAWTWPEFAVESAQFQTTWRGLYLTIHERK